PPGVRLHHLIHETQEVHGGPAVADMRDYFAGGDFQSCQQRLRAMADVLVGPSADFFGSQGQQRLSPVERLCISIGVWSRFWSTLPLPALLGSNSRNNEWKKLRKLYRGT